jgi:alkylated DNA repair dioxygenase AlkB
MTLLGSLDLERYPLDRLDEAPGRALVRHCREQLKGTGMFSLHGFVLATAVQDCAHELAKQMRTASFTHQRLHNIYFTPEIEGIDADHPALTVHATTNHVLTADQVAKTLVCELYEWPALRKFLALVMGKPTLHLMTDPLARVNVMSYRDGEGLGWHFDRSEFTTTLLLQEATDGGKFEYRSGMRSATDANFDGVARLLNNDDPAVETLPLQPGTLNVFRGINTAHRVTPTRGNQARLVCVFSYYDRPNVMFSEREQLGFYGRTMR